MRVYRLAPLRSRIGETEHYYAFRAAQGLVLKRPGWILDRFSAVPSQSLLYRTEIAPSPQGLPAAQKELYEECGWEYVGCRDVYCYFTGPSSKSLPELHTNPELQASGLKRLRRRYLANLVSPFLLFLPLVLSFLLPQRKDFLRYLVEGFSIFLLIGLFLLLAAGAAIYQAVLLSRLIRGMKQGKPIDHSADWRRGRAVRWGLSFFGGLLLTLHLLLCVWEGLPIKAPLPQEGEGLPCLLLTETQPGLRRALPEEAEQVVGYSEKWERHHTLLAPELHSTYEKAVSENHSKGDCWMYQRYYRVLSPSLARALAFSMAEHNIWGEGMDAFESLSISGLDLALAGPHTLILQKEHQVMEITYWGNLSFPQIARLVSEKWGAAENGEKAAFSHPL